MANSVGNRIGAWHSLILIVVKRSVTRLPPHLVVRRSLNTMRRLLQLSEHAERAAPDQKTLSPLMSPPFQSAPPNADVYPPQPTTEILSRRIKVNSVSAAQRHVRFWTQLGVGYTLSRIAHMPANLGSINCGFRRR